MIKNAQGYTRFNLSKIILKTKLELTIPDIEEQKKIYKKLDILEDQLDIIQNNLNKTSNYQKSLINIIFQ